MKFAITAIRPLCIESVEDMVFFTEVLELVEDGVYTCQLKTRTTGSPGETTFPFAFRVSELKAALCVVTSTSNDLTYVVYPLRKGNRHEEKNAAILASMENLLKLHLAGVKALEIIKIDHELARRMERRDALCEQLEKLNI